MSKWIGPDPGPGQRLRALNSAQIAAAAKATRIGQAKLESLAQGKGQLSADELQRLRAWLADYKPT